ncbi:MAG: GNAT family N-acetyltransferase [Sulfitobacter litoralis]|jgi:GNAT superfamily N-acetyltransferase|uniref:GNAT family N-acetyltransferase n=2 Tax=root TaxID=1 RepID=A0A1H0HIH7_9RHOB|nr:MULTISPECIES: GNAT family N-acetyltransferase [Sulfitobacter]MBQ0716467.1 GNAT family N-acetyltransferase [Sulfitobacter litoralis]MBQ0765230.1 GNAT family N-acetyltransferase [Sulfitobacter litoralis]MBQ0802135.1 GNAT family N-acetyltransferase [Sulfitobacter litoralis]MCF7727194.1 GNAT family N-acetyltransferase [Sulfitobacter sp. M22]MCF7778557.1 GNAT family N-acetyltransferase [Sulfitobacter sp. M220]|tara:strand:+ start:1494 stop:2084 length:591 start_codon:yes stop_codon:yes gene_type:complete
MLTDGYHDVPLGKLAMVVTHLEMREAAPSRDVPAPEGVTLRALSPTLDWYRDIFRRVGQDWLWFGRLTKTDAELQALLSDADTQFFTLTKDGSDEALLELKFTADGTCELAYFGLTPALIGSGAGRYLMNHAIRTAWARPISRFHLHTCTLDSPQAMSFYIRSGFTPYKRQVEVADDPRLIDLLDKDAGAHVPTIG